MYQFVNLKMYQCLFQRQIVLSFKQIAMLSLAKTHHSFELEVESETSKNDSCIRGKKEKITCFYHGNRSDVKFPNRHLILD